MTFEYTMKENSMEQGSRDSITAAVNSAIAELEGGQFEKMTAADLVAWINKWYGKATYKHLILALRAFAKGK